MMGREAGPLGAPPPARSHQDVEREHLLQDGDRRLLVALQAVCTWSVAAVSRTCGRAGLTPEILWEWTCRDALWALVLAKGVLSARVGSSPLLAMPEELPQLQSDALFAVLGLASPSVAFLGLAQCEGGQHTIALRNRQLMFHRSDLASAVVGCQLLQALLTTALREGGRCGPALAGFLAGLLQPDVAAVRGFTSE
ncbi:unnamed protein product, partial [Prorocentrum cordatum]